MRSSMMRSVTIASCVLALAFADGLAADETSRAAQTDSLQKMHAVKVYPDGMFDYDYLKAHVPYLNYVRDRMQAELYLLITARATGAGGLEYTATIIGQRQFALMNDTLVYCSKPTDAAEVVRAGVVHMLKMGLMRYVARTPIGESITIAYRGKARPTDVTDPWDSWVFSLACSPSFSGSQVDTRSSVSGHISADRVTPDLKLAFTAYSYYSASEQELPSKTLKIIRRTSSFDALAVKSLAAHWSLGGAGEIYAQSHQNKKRYYSIAPAIEYSVFPYSESTRRYMALFSQIDFTDVTYQELTIYNKTSEKLWSYTITVPASIIEPWGNVYASMKWIQYFHDESIYRLSLSSGISFQVFKGLWINASGSYSRIHDQIDQPRRTLSDEEILLDLKKLASTYSYTFGIGFSYTFGSIYSNVVNPRFIGY